MIYISESHDLTLTTADCQATVGNAIVLDKKCCWCCCMEFVTVNGVPCRLPGSHGIIYPWSPPRVGVDLKVILVLEDGLWMSASFYLQFVCTAFVLHKSMEYLSPNLSRTDMTQRSWEMRLDSGRGLNCSKLKGRLPIMGKGTTTRV
ncbi:hypothetical protein EDB19DRAFT_1790842 [Suillus lakei]|nr:hypothetical protein EDB19DRAFT_1790842 [Suillus lakei]